MASVLVALCVTAWGAPIAWNGSVDASWDTLDNWTPNTALPGLGDDVSFPAVIPATGSTITLTAGELANSLAFSNSYTLTGGDLTLGATQSINVGANTVTIASALKDGGLGGYIKKSGSGTLILTGDNSAYNRWADVNAGIVSLRSNNAVLGGYFHVTNAASMVDLQGNISTPGTTNIYLSGTATNDDPSFRSLSGANTWGGGIILHGGGGRHNVGVDTGSTLTVTGGVSQTTAGSLWKVGGGTLTLNGAGTYTLGTALVSGALQFGVYNALGSGTVTLGDTSTGANNIALLATFANASNQITNPIVVSNLAAGEVRLGTAQFSVGAVPTLFNGTITLNRDVVLQAGNADRTTFLGRITGTGNITIDSQNTGQRITFDNNANDFVGNVTVNSNTILQLNGTTVIPDASDLTVNGTLYFNSTGEAVDALNGSGVIQIHPSVSTSPNFTIGADGGGGTFSGTIRNGGAGGATVRLTKAGGGTQTMSGDLDHTGGTFVNGGILRLAQPGVPFPSAGSTGQFGSAHTTTVNAGATLEAAANWVFGDGLADKVVVNGGTLAFVGADNYLGNIELTGGQITTSGGSRPWRTGNWGSGLITVNASAVASTIAGSLTFVGTASAPRTTFSVADGAAANDLAMSANISDHPGFEGQMRLVKDGPGTMLLTGNSTFTGGVTVNQGTIKIGSMTALGNRNTSFSTVTVASGGAVDFDGVWDATYGYTIAGTGVGGTGALLNTGAAIGLAYAQCSNIRLSADASIGGTGNWALLTWGYNPTTLDLNGYTLTKTGANTISLCNATVTAGTISVQQGILAVAQRACDASAADFILADAAGVALNLGGFDLPIASLAGGGDSGGSVNLGANRLTIGGAASTTYAGVIGGTGGLTRTGSGSLTLAGTNSYTGPTIVSGGTLLVNGSITSNVTVTGGLLGGAGTIFGNVDVQGGGTASAGNTPGHLLIGGSYTQSGTMLAEIGGLGQGTTYDWIEVGGAATLGGVIEVDLVNGFVPEPGDYFDILTAGGGITNPDLSEVTFDFSNAGAGPGWWTFIVPLDGGGEALRLVASPEPATLTLLALGGLCLLRRRRRRN